MKRLFLVILRITNWLEIAVFITGSGFMLLIFGLIIAAGIFLPPGESPLLDMAVTITLIGIGLFATLVWIELVKQNWPKPTMSAQWAESITHELQLR